MSTPIIATKLYIPLPRPKLVLRPRLIERLNEGLQRSLTLISAPAGFGKTSLLANWHASVRSELRVLSSALSHPHQAQTSNLKPQTFKVAWLALDESDNDPSQFLTYLVAALQTIDSNMGAGMLRILQSPQPLPAALFLTSLINAVAETPQEFILVLD